MQEAVSDIHFCLYTVCLLTFLLVWANILSMMNRDFMTPGELGHLIAMNVRALRKSRKLSLKHLSEMSGVSYGSMKRFESTGEIALVSLLKIAIVLDCADAFEGLFADSGPMSIQDIIDGNLQGAGSSYGQRAGRDPCDVSGAARGF